MKKNELDKKNRLKKLEEAKELALIAEYDSAFEILDYLLKSDENDLDALRSKGNKLEMKALRMQNDISDEEVQVFFDEALKCYEKISKIDPDNILNLIDLGDHWSNKENFDIALPFYEKAIELLKKGEFTISHKDECEEAFFGKSELLREMGKEKEADQCKKEGVEFFPTSILLGGREE
ncbi:MAG: hypothetical protein HOK41_05330 [Nitrospina sp.]|jgi:tetratricopeptide (TPR) repeat protein|nr:hypothetical protein [Nitrospina sp.]MBT6717482.1 hypothetical protein [Nitrospina sp.]